VPSKLSDADKFDLQQYITRCYGSLTTFNVLFKNKNDLFRTSAQGSAAARPDAWMQWSEWINTGASGSGRVDDTKGHLQGEIRGLAKLVKMRGDAMRWTGSPKGEKAGCSRVNGARGSGAT
jgi:hypothetical protein